MRSASSVVREGTTIDVAHARRAASRGAVPLGRADARVDRRCSGPLLARVRRGSRRAPGWRRLRFAADRHAPVGARGARARRSSSSTGTCAARPTGFAARRSRSSSRASARPRTSSWPRSSPKGTTVIDNAAREPEIADLADVPERDGRADRRCGHVDDRGRGRARGAARRDARDDPRPRRGRDVPRRGRGHRRRGRCCGTLAPTTWRCTSASSATWASIATPTLDGIWARGPAALRLGRRVDASVPGRRDRLQAALHRDARGRRRRRHRDREPVRRTVPLRRRARPDGRRHAHRRPPRGRARQAPAVGCAGAGARHPRRRGARRRRARSPRARPRCPASSTSIAATRTSWASCRPRRLEVPTGAAPSRALSPIAATDRSRRDAGNIESR